MGTMKSRPINLKNMHCTFAQRASMFRHKRFRNVLRRRVCPESMRTEHHAMYAADPALHFINQSATNERSPHVQVVVEDDEIGVRAHVQRALALFQS